MALKILLADDNITAQKMGSKILTDAGYEVVAVSNGAAALKKIASHKPGLLILDVYMPGYTGLEVCLKIKSAAETAALPVVLTVTNMEPFNPEDGNRVKADGVMIKPFEATDLLAIVQKLEAKLQPAAPAPPEPKGEAAKKAAAEFQDASYEEWKAEATPEETGDAAQHVTVPREMAVAPALGMEDMLVQAPAPEPQVASAAAFEMAGLEIAQPYETPAPLTEQQPAEPAAAEPAIAPAPGVEFTSAPLVGDLEVAPAAELELTEHAAAAEVQIVRDPALVTDPADIAQFATRFGDAPGQPSFSDLEPSAQPEAVAAIPEISESAEAAPFSFEAPPQEALAQEESGSLEARSQDQMVQETPPMVEAAPVQDFVRQVDSSAASLEDEMRRAFDVGSGAAAAPALAPEPVLPPPEPEPVVEAPPILEATPFIDAPPAPVVEPPSSPPPLAAIPDKLVEQFAAELAQVAPAEVNAEDVPPVAEAAPEPAPVAPFDEQRVSEAVQRVLGRYKDELVAAIVRELKS